MLDYEELEDGTLGTTLAAPPPEAQASVTADIWGDYDSGWSPLLGENLITHDTRGLSYPPVWQAIKQIAGDGGMLDCQLIERDPDGQNPRVATNAANNRLMAKHPNNIQTPYLFKQLLWHHMLWGGDGRAAIIRDGNGIPVELIPLLPDRSWTTLVLDEANRSTDKLHITNVYYNFGSRGQGRQQYINPYDESTHAVIPDRDVFHFQNLSYDAISGYSMPSIFRRTLGIGTGSDLKVLATLNRAGVPPLVLLAPPGAFKTENDAVEFLRNWNEYHAGILNSGKTGLLREGIQPHQLTATNRDEQFEELKKLTRQDVASIFNIPVQMLGDTDAQTMSNLEQNLRWYRQRTLRPHITNWEHECNHKLLTDRQKASGRYEFKYDTKPLDLTDISTRTQYYDMGRKNNAFSGDDIREMEGLPRLDLPETTSYANPNTSSAMPAEESEEDDAQALELIRVRCRELAEAERGRITEAATCKRQDTFARRIDIAYSKQANTLGNVIENYGGDVDRIAEYCSDRKQNLLTRAYEKGHETEPRDDAEDLAGYIFDTFFRSNGDAMHAM